MEAETSDSLTPKFSLVDPHSILLKMKKGIKSAAVVESEAQTLETDIAASAAHDVHHLYCL